MEETGAMEPLSVSLVATSTNNTKDSNSRRGEDDVNDGSADIRAGDRSVAPTSSSGPGPQAARGTGAATAAAGVPFSVGQLVHVAARTWSGINEHGGVGRVTGLRTDDGGGGDGSRQTTNENLNQQLRPSSKKLETNDDDADKNNNDKLPNQQQSRLQRRLLVSVRYVIDGRRERDVDSKYVQCYKSRPKLRDRSMMMGRCSHCGSLRTDCGSCDLYAEFRQQQQPRSVPTASRRSTINKLSEKTGEKVHTKQRMKAKKASSSLPSLLLSSSSESSVSGSSDDVSDVGKRLEQRRLRDRRYKRFKLQQSKARGGSRRRQRRYHDPRGRRRSLLEHESMLLHLEDEAASKNELHNNKETQGGVEAGVGVTQKSSDKPDFKSSGLGLTSSSSSEDSESDHEESQTFQQLVLTQQESRSPRRRRPFRSPRQRKLRNHKKSTIHMGASDLVASASQEAQSVSSPGTVESSSSENDDGDMLPYPDDDSSDDHDDDLSGDNAEDTQHSFGIATFGGSTNDHDFIQPEGDAQRLPSDIRDETNSIAYPELPSFFDEKIKNLRKAGLPTAKQQLVALERKWKYIQQQPLQEETASGHSKRELLEER